MATRKKNCHLGLQIHHAAQEYLQKIDDYMSDLYSYMDQYLEDAKKTFNT